MNASSHIRLLSDVALYCGGVYYVFEGNFLVGFALLSASAFTYHWVRS